MNVPQVDMLYKLSTNLNPLELFGGSSRLFSCNSFFECVLKISALDLSQRKFWQHFGRSTETLFWEDPRFSSGLRHFQAFPDIRYSIKNELRSESPSFSRIDKIVYKVRDRRWFWENLRKICSEKSNRQPEGKVPWLFCNRLKRFTIFRNTSVGPENQPPEHGMSHFDHSMVQKSKNWRKSQIKYMLIKFFDRKGIVHKEFVGRSQMVY